MERFRFGTFSTVVLLVTLLVLPEIASVAWAVVAQVLKLLGVHDQVVALALAAHGQLANPSRYAEGFLVVAAAIIGAASIAWLWQAQTSIKLRSGDSIPDINFTNLACSLLCMMLFGGLYIVYGVVYA